IVIEGVESLYPANIDVIPDRIEAGTFLMAGALMGKITLDEVNPEHLDAVLQKLKEVGALVKTTSNSVTIEPGGLKPVDMKTAVYPGFATDLQ
ncbi:MAG: UDP-N-acetylglucosamine 1-carboxyvinyltransferase, partial [Candidatus Neomarinimicrobiota bacterium]